MRILELVEGPPFRAARIERLDDVDPHSTRAVAPALQLRERGMAVLPPMALGLAATAFENVDVHVPAGAVPKDGPSAVRLPARHRKDLHEVPEITRAALRFTWLEAVDDAVAGALGDRLRRPAGEFRRV